MQNRKYCSFRNFKKPKILTASENGETENTDRFRKMGKPKILTASENGKTEETDRFRKWKNGKY